MAIGIIQPDLSLLSPNNPCMQAADPQACINSMVAGAPQYTGSDSQCDPGLIASTINYWTGQNACTPAPSLPSGPSLLLYFALGAVGIILLLNMLEGGRR